MSNKDDLAALLDDMRPRLKRIASANPAAFVHDLMEYLLGCCDKADINPQAVLDEVRKAHPNKFLS